ncbi:MAG: cob(I)yrinic acid a,c-diamide adenosyltransferase [bacterium]|nr:cob(I)yrinic acid a,c-diamide adenosyltransferase [bacterium]
MGIKIYTRTGDKGQTSLFGGKRVSKASQRVDTYGTVDELNSIIGVVIAHLKPSERILKRELEAVQHDLFSIGSYLASPEIKSSEFRVKSLGARVEDFEKLIDRLTEKLPELKNFILPGGGKAGSFLHLARTTCRKTERKIIALSKKEQVDDGVVKYCNRLSDLLFTMARFVNHREKKKETIWSHT